MLHCQFSLRPEAVWHTKVESPPGIFNGVNLGKPVPLLDPFGNVQVDCSIQKAGFSTIAPFSANPIVRTNLVKPLLSMWVILINVPDCRWTANRGHTSRQYYLLRPCVKFHQFGTLLLQRHNVRQSRLGEPDHNGGHCTAQVGVDPSVPVDKQFAYVISSTLFSASGTKTIYYALEPNNTTSARSINMLVTGSNPPVTLTYTINQQAGPSNTTPPPTINSGGGSQMPPASFITDRLHRVRFSPFSDPTWDLRIREPRRTVFLCSRLLPALAFPFPTGREIRYKPCPSLRRSSRSMPSSSQCSPGKGTDYADVQWRRRSSPDCHHRGERVRSVRGLCRSRTRDRSERVARWYPPSEHRHSYRGAEYVCGSVGYRFGPDLGESHLSGRGSPRSVRPDHKL